MARRRVKLSTSADEWDFLADRGRYRRIICHSRQHLRWIKTNWNRRIRRAGRDDLREEVEEMEREKWET